VFKTPCASVVCYVRLFRFLHATWFDPLRGLVFHLTAPAFIAWLRSPLRFWYTTSGSLPHRVSENCGLYWTFGCVPFSRTPAFPSSDVSTYPYRTPRVRVGFLHVCWIWTAFTLRCVVRFTFKRITHVLRTLIHVARSYAPFLLPALRTSRFAFHAVTGFMVCACACWFPQIPARSVCRGFLVAHREWGGSPHTHIHTPQFTHTVHSSHSLHFTRLLHTHTQLHTVWLHTHFGLPLTGFR